MPPDNVRYFHHVKIEAYTLAALSKIVPHKKPIAQDMSCIFDNSNLDSPDSWAQLSEPLMMIIKAQEPEEITFNFKQFPFSVNELPELLALLQRVKNLPSTKEIVLKVQVGDSAVLDEMLQWIEILEIPNMTIFHTLSRSRKKLSNRAQGILSKQKHLRFFQNIGWSMNQRTFKKMIGNEGLTYIMADMHEKSLSRSTLKLVKKRLSQGNVSIGALHAGKVVLDFHCLQLSMQNKNHVSTMWGKLKSCYEVEYHRVKLIVIGEGGAGKTSLVRSLMGKPFIKSHVSTEVADTDLSVNIVEASGLDERINWKLNQTTSNVLSQELVSIFFGRNGVHDFFHPENIYSSIDLDEGKTVNYLKDKMRNPAVNPSQPIPFTNYPLSIWDFGGQNCFASIRHLFLTEKAIYIMVFSIPSLIADPASEMKKISNWIESVLSHAKECRFVFVGTKARKYMRKQFILTNISLWILELVEEKELKVVFNVEQTQAFFPVENSYRWKRRTVGRIRRAITSGQEDFLRATEHGYPTRCPLYFLMVLDILMMRNAEVIGEGEAFHMLQEFGFTRTSVEKALKFFDERGGIIYVSNIKPILNRIILNPKWLLNALARVIFDSTQHQKNHRAKLCPEQRDIYDYYSLHGIASKEFISNVLWIEYEVEEKEFLFALCSKKGLFADYNFFNEVTLSSENIMVPSMVRLFDNIKKPDVLGAGNSFSLCSQGKFAVGMFEQFLSVLITMSSENKARVPPKVSRGYAEVELLENIIVLVALDLENQKIDIGIHHYNAHVSVETVSEYLQQCVQKFTEECLDDVDDLAVLHHYNEITDGAL